MTKETYKYFFYILLTAFLTLFFSACGEKEKKPEELAVGNWFTSQNRAYIFLVISPANTWQSTVKIPDVTGKIVTSKGAASGMWHIEDNKMVFTVAESEIDMVWEKNSTAFFDIVEISEQKMQLREKTGHVVVWNSTASQKSAAQSTQGNLLPWGPVAVNLNKNRTHDKDRYLCLNMNLVLREMMPGQEIPPIHPKARDAALIFLSSLVFNDVKDFDSIKKQNKKLADVLNPYMNFLVEEIKIEHVIVSTEPDKVEEFMIEHSLTPEPETPAEGEGTEAQKEPEKKS